MNLSVIYCTHHTAPLAVREKLAFATPEQLTRAYSALKARRPRGEMVVLSTCNRVELYSAEPEAPLALPEVAEFMAEFHGVPASEFLDQLREQTGPEVVRRLFEIAASLDSLVLGEPQIVNQVKEAYRVAAEHDACGPLTHALFQGAIRASNRVRTETKLSLGHTSIASVAVGDFGKSIFESFANKRVLVIGAGEMAEETLRYLKDEGFGSLTIVNRSLERATRLAQDWGGSVRPWDELDAALGQADIIVSTTGAAEPVVTAERFRLARRQAKARQPVFILDLGAPRDFSTDVGQLDDVFLYDIDALERTCQENRKLRVREIESAQQIITEETERFIGELHHRAGSEIVVRLREGWHEISRQELQRLFQKRPELSATDREEIEKSVGRIVNKLLHPPLAALRDESKDGSAQGLIEALRRLFGLQG